jgi:hypothetical protein
MRANLFVQSDGVPVNLVEEDGKVVLRVGSKSYGPGDIVRRISGLLVREPRLETPFRTNDVVRDWMRQPARTEAERDLASRFLEKTWANRLADEE